MFNLDAFSVIAVALLEQILADTQVSTNFIDKTPTEPIYFNIPKKELVRRQYKLPNLYSYTNLVKFMCENKNEFVKVFVNNKLSISKFFDSPKYKYAVTEGIKSRLLHSGNKQLHLDLSNFYHTLYTHSIPWMIMGKENAKSHRTGGFANNLDILIEACQYGETHGIPAGNVPSRIIAELFMCHFDNKLGNKGFKYARYVDDFTFAYSLEIEKEEFMEQVNLLCRDYNLYLNSEKTMTEEFPQNNQRSKSFIFNFFDNHNFADSDTKIQRDLISDYIDLCITEESRGNKGSLKIIFSGLLRNIVYFGKFGNQKIDDLFLCIDYRTQTSLLEKIIDISLKKPELTNRFMDLFENLFTTSNLRRKAKKSNTKVF
ncbi:RNA-directed DNA polymerase [Streptococcus uberis]|nr:RNA-directed DNA polymerase [Streptococcus uberis]